ncbi:MAG: hypothetical protein ACREUF_13530, partial [Solimonas sp.]
AAMVCGTVYVAWRAIAERLLTARQLCGVLLLWTVFGAAWLTLLRMAGMPHARMLTIEAVGMLWPAWLPLMASVVVPWALSRIRHT